MVTGHTDGYVYQWKDSILSDNGSSIPCRWSSKDFSASLLRPGIAFRKIMLRSLGIEYEGSGTEADLNFYLSKDSGESWDGPYPVTLAATSGTAVLSEKITGDRIRWKFVHDTADQSFRITRFIPEFEILGFPLTDDSL
jgi:hypothetical protein